MRRNVCKLPCMGGVDNNEKFCSCPIFTVYLMPSCKWPLKPKLVSSNQKSSEKKLCRVGASDGISPKTRFEFPARSQQII